MNAIAKPQAGALAMTDEDMINVLSTSLYPGAKPESIKMVMSYCQAAQLDPMQKPVHIVPMSVKNPGGSGYSMRDVIMPGVGLYRIQADRSGTLAGMSAPEFGPMIEEKFNDKQGNQVTVSYPEWCEVTVSKMVGPAGLDPVDFTAREYWIENYATDSRNSTAPNAMWRKRPRGQLAKCAEAQALRKGWPEIGQAPTAEEMLGKENDITDQAVVASYGEAERLEPAALPDYTDDDLLKNLPAWRSMFEIGKSTPEHVIAMVSAKYTLNDQQKETIRGEYANGSA